MIKCAAANGHVASIPEDESLTRLAVAQPVQVFFIHPDAVPNLMPQSYLDFSLRLLPGRAATQYRLPVDRDFIWEGKTGTFPFRQGHSAVQPKEGPWLFQQLQVFLSRPLFHHDIHVGDGLYHFGRDLAVCLAHQPDELAARNVDQLPIPGSKPAR